MKLFIGFLLFVWLLCGFVGAWMLDDMRFKTIARGPMSLLAGYNAAPEYQLGGL
jgi:hypothetical protein